MGITVFNHAQLEMLKMMSRVTDERILDDLRQAVSDFFARKGSLVQGLFVARSVVAAILAQIAFLACGVNETRDFGAAYLDALRQLRLELVILGLGQPLGISHYFASDMCR